MLDGNKAVRFCKHSVNHCLVLKKCINSVLFAHDLTGKKTSATKGPKKLAPIHAAKVVGKQSFKGHPQHNCPCDVT